ncbi:MAG: DNA methyltransferase [Rhodospirillaceae bacterium]|nr:DNA methyltransferase [Rhodospirillaceae bacterium]MDE0618693.1 DNA methyltransferase [Rhodospirillaceae bacterium]
MTESANWQNRTLFHGDNLGFLRAMNSESVDLIATDPPFNKGRDFHATPDSLAAGAKFQDRWSWERDVHEDWSDQIRDDYPFLMEAIESARYAHSDGMGAYMCFMAVRLLEMRRLLKPTGSIYLHCDPTASHYLKACMDAIFGWRNFRNEIVWKRTPAKALMTKRLPTNHDVILSYQRSDQAAWNSDVVFRPYDESNMDEKTASKYRHRDDGGRLYRLDNLINPNRDRPNLTYEFLGVTRVWRWTRERMEAAHAEGRVVQTGPGRVPQLKRYLDEQRGRPMGDVWNDVAPINSRADERVGYPTQKPLALYERVIAASSNPGEIVCDPFAGCATTLVAAEKLQRQWVGMDIWESAHRLVTERLRDTTGLFGEVTFTDAPPERTDDGGEAAPFLRVKQRVKEPEGPRWTRAEMYAHLLDQHGPVCQGCDRSFDDPRYLELDHNVPRSDGGINHVTNRILLCGPCNRLKSNIFTLSGLWRENKKRGYMR